MRSFCRLASVIFCLTPDMEASADFLICSTLIRTNHDNDYLIKLNGDSTALQASLSHYFKLITTCI